MTSFIGLRPWAEDSGIIEVTTDSGDTIDLHNATTLERLSIEISVRPKLLLRFRVDQGGAFDLVFSAVDGLSLTSAAGPPLPPDLDLSRVETFYSIAYSQDQAGGLFEVDTILVSLTFHAASVTLLNAG
jgi:hypothetical protein